jgi:hypothetical protein
MSRFVMPPINSNSNSHLNNNPPTSLWQLKPWWCQPWSIMLTGMAIPLGSWLWLGRWWITLPIVLLVGLWWWMFLYLVPQQFRAGQLAEPLADQHLQ